MTASRWPSKTIAIDYDDTIHDRQNPKEGRKLGPPLAGAKEALEALKAAGWKIIIHSCNRPKVIADWMIYYEIPYDYIWDQVGKPVADWYVDDRAIEFRGSWADVLEKIARG